MVTVSAPSRLCLFGEHQDYLDLAVIAMAIDLQFQAKACPASHGALHVKIRDRQINVLQQENPGLYEEFWFDPRVEQEYTSSRDYLRSSINVLRRHGVTIPSADLVLDSTIPIGKGMCSSSTMIVAFMKALLALADDPQASDAAYIAELAWKAEIREFNEPGGRMDYYTSLLGGLLHLDFSGDSVSIEPLQVRLAGCFLLFDSLEDKDTMKALRSAKQPTLEALAALFKLDRGIRSLRELAATPSREALLSRLAEKHQNILQAQLINMKLLNNALEMLRSGHCDDKRFGSMLTAHHLQLADNMELSTPRIDQILTAAQAAGAWGGKLNGSGGGGCAYVYAPAEAADDILSSVAKLGYPGKKVRCFVFDTT